MPGAGGVGATVTSFGFGLAPGGWKNGRKSSARTFGRVSSGNIDLTGFDGLASAAGAGVLSVGGGDAWFGVAAGVVPSAVAATSGDGGITSEVLAASGAG
jgi:hypothetical protein